MTEKKLIQLVPNKWVSEEILILITGLTKHARKLARLSAHNEQCMAKHKAWEAAGFDHAAKPLLRPFPDDLRGIQCGAMTRGGTPCKRTDIHASGRCKYHGGRSTGAKTEEGKARQREGYRRWLEEKRRADAGTQDDGTQ